MPDIVGSTEADALAALDAAELSTGDRTEVNDDTTANGSVVSQDPAPGTELAKGSAVAYVVSLGPVVEPFGLGGDLDQPNVSAQLDEVATTISDIRGLPLGSTPYDDATKKEQKELLASRSAIIHDPSAVAGEEATLKRMGLLPEGANLGKMLEQLYGQELPIAYLEQRGRTSVLDTLDKLSVPQRAMAAREFGRAVVNQEFGIDRARVGDSSDGDGAIAGLALEQGDGTATMLAWSAANVTAGNQSKVEGVIVPGKDSILDSMPPILAREYSFPFLEGRAFVDKLRSGADWSGVDSAWGNPPESTEQIMHPKKYPGDRPTTISIDGLAGALGGGWSEGWQQTMGELRIGVWLADGAPGTQDGPRAPVKLPKAGAAGGWGGDRLVSLDGPDGAWVIVWQTKWDAADDVDPFISAATAAMADLAGAHVALAADVSGGVSNPALVIMTSAADTLAV
ncbi:MAG: PASTA domain-containing protein, partial [Chloroflexota bacterium]